MWRFLKTVGIILFAIYFFYGCGGGGGSETKSVTTTPPPTNPTPTPVPPVPGNYITHENYTNKDCYWHLKELGDGYICWTEFYDNDFIYEEDSLVLYLEGKDTNIDIETIEMSIYNGLTLVAGPFLTKSNLYSYEITYPTDQYQVPTGDVFLTTFLDNTMIPEGYLTINLLITHKDKINGYLSRKELMTSKITKLSGNRPRTDYKAPSVTYAHDIQFDPVTVVPGLTDTTTVTILMNDLGRNLDIWSDNTIAQISLYPATPEVGKVNDINISITGKDYFGGTLEWAYYQKEVSIDPNLRTGGWFIKYITLTDYLQNSETSEMFPFRPTYHLYVK